VRIEELIGRNVKQAREEAGLSQRQLGEQLGWFPQAVSAAEKGRRDWVAEDLVNVAWALRRPVAYFFRVPEGASPWDILDSNPNLIHLEWVSGETTATRSPEEIAAEIARLTKELQRWAAAQKEST
jgi:transcriptional regulator with XRE-family HTH domain